MRQERGSMFKAIASVLAIAGLAVMILASLLVSVGPVARAANQWVTVGDFFFDPGSITINVGDTVTWQNNATSTPHTATSTSAPSGGAFDSGTISAGGGMYTHTFTIAGTYNYHCTLHPTLMSGTITVTSAIPEFSSFTFVVLGLLVMMLGVTLARRRY
jgi:plastocyanin